VVKCVMNARSQIRGSALVEDINQKFTARMTNQVRWREATGGRTAGAEEKDAAEGRTVGAEAAAPPEGPSAGSKQIVSDTTLEVRRG
jgi:hypothetical protein